MPELLSYDFIQRALLASAVVGLVAPLVGVFLVQRRLALIGDGIGHVALAGVAVGVVTGQAPVWTALVASVLAGVAIELIRARGGPGGDTALAIVFYGGIAAGVVILSRVPRGTSTSLTGYLFGSITTVSAGELVTFVVLAAVVAMVLGVLWPWFFAVAQDEEYAVARGMPVLPLNLLLSSLVAVTVVVSMRVVGLLLISALMVVPNATGQILGRSFAGAVRWAVGLGVVSAVGGVVASYYADSPSGATIVVLAVGLFVLVAIGASVIRAAGWSRSAAPVDGDHVHTEVCGHDLVLHDDHVDYVHDGHRHTERGAVHEEAER